MRKIILLPIYIIVFGIMVLASAYLTFKVLSFSRTVAVPDLRGNTLLEATNILSANSLRIKVDGEDFDPIVSSGSIMRQDIPPGSEVKERRVVRVVISKGAKASSIPNLINLSLEEAESVILKNGLKAQKIIRVHSGTVERDRIISQNPGSDDSIEALQQSYRSKHYYGLTLVVSSGPYDIIYRCPDFSGAYKNDALEVISRLFMKADLKGTGERVKSQRPKPNSLIRTGDNIQLFLEGE